MQNTIKCKDNFDNMVELDVNKFKFRPSVYGFILNDKNELLILKSKGNNKIWFPGGGVEVGEKIEEALKREVYEETKLVNVNVEKFIFFKENFFYDKYCNNAMHAFLFFYLCRTQELKLAKNNEIDDGDATDLQWINFNDIRKEDLADLKDDIYNNLKNIFENR